VATRWADRYDRPHAFASAPRGLPKRVIDRKPITGPAAWYGSALADSDEWIYRLSNADIDEIDAAVAGIRHRGLAMSQMTKGDFRLPHLGPVLEDIQREVVSGRGFVLVRGVPVERYARPEVAVAYLGIGLHFGWPVSQNARGHLVGHVRDMGLDPTDPNHRLYATGARQQFHTDSCDIVGLLCLQPALEGGLSSIASSVTIYNEMLDARPDLVPVLERPFVLDRKGEIPAGKGPYYELPVFHHFAGYLTTVYAREFIDCAQRFDEVPRLTAEQVEAMDVLDALAAREDIRLDMTLAPGDMQFLHNHQILHARTAFRDHPEPERKRHLLRLWLAPPNARPLPPAFAERYGTIEAGTRRGGISVPGVTPWVPLDPE
jgi:hypothetical protein